jgi:hypothetical protein
MWSGPPGRRIDGRDGGRQCEERIVRARGNAMRCDAMRWTGQRVCEDGKERMEYVTV